MDVVVQSKYVYTCTVLVSAITSILTITSYLKVAMHIVYPLHVFCQFGITGQGIAGV